MVGYASGARMRVLSAISEACGWLLLLGAANGVLTAHSIETALLGATIVFVNTIGRSRREQSRRSLSLSLGLHLPPSDPRSRLFQPPPTPDKPS